MSGECNECGRKFATSDHGCVNQMTGDDDCDGWVKPMTPTLEQRETDAVLALATKIMHGPYREMAYDLEHAAAAVRGQPGRYAAIGVLVTWLASEEHKPRLEPEGGGWACVLSNFSPFFFDADSLLLALNAACNAVLDEQEGGGA